MRLDEDGAEAVEQLEGSDDVALDEDAGEDGGGRPPSCADGHFIEPLFQWELPYRSTSNVTAAAAAEHILHSGEARAVDMAGCVRQTRRSKIRDSRLGTDKVVAVNPRYGRALYALYDMLFGKTLCGVILE